MKLGTQIRLPDGREGTVVFNSLIGVGIKWGLHDPDPKDFEGTDGNTVCESLPEDWEWETDGLLRDPWPNCEHSTGFKLDQFLGEEFEVIKDGKEF